MDFPQLFLQRYEVLYDFWLEGFWKITPEDLLRQRPHARVNSIAWTMWHLCRAQDGLNRFVVNRQQVLDEGDWNRKMNLPWRHNGNGMTFAEVDDLGQRVDLGALRGYFEAVHERTLEIVATMDMDILAAVVRRDRIRKVLFDEGWSRSSDSAAVETYAGWTKGKFLMNHGLTHPFQHVGEMGVIASLLGVEFE